MAANVNPPEDHQRNRRQEPAARGGNPGITNLSPNSETSEESSLFSIHWSTREQLILEKGLARYSSEKQIQQYAKIASRLPKKTVRDVALRCKWMTSKESNGGRKDGHNSAKSTKGRKGKSLDTSNRPYVMFAVNEDDDRSQKAVDGDIGQLLEQNVQAFYQISENLAAYQFRRNVNLFVQAQNNIVQILNNLANMPDLMKQMPPLSERLNEELANSIFTWASLQMLS